MDEFAKKHSQRQSIHIEMMIDEGPTKKSKISLAQIPAIQLKKEIKVLNRVCCLKVNRNWRIKKQLLVTTSVVFLVVLSIVLVFLGVNLYFTRFNIQNQIEQNVKDKTHEYLTSFQYAFNKAFFNIHNTCVETLNLVNEILNGYLDPVSNTFKYDMIKEYPITINPKFYFMGDDIPKEDLAPRDYDSRLHPKNFSLKYWGYASFLTDNNRYYSSKAEKYLKACSILNNVLNDILWNNTKKYLVSVFFGFETDKLFVYYPGFQIGKNEQNVWKNYDPTTRVWYKVAEKYSKSNGNNTLKTGVRISPPYYDLATNSKLTSYVKAIIDSSGEFLGVLGVDFDLNNFQKSFESVPLNRSVLLLVDENGLVMNNPYPNSTNSQEPYYIYQSNITNLTLDNWNTIQDPLTFNETIRMKNSLGNDIMVIRSTILSDDNEILFYIIVQTPTDETEIGLTELGEQRDDNYWMVLFALGSSYIFIIFVTIFTTFICSYKMMIPLMKLTKIAKHINRTNNKKQLSEEDKKKIYQLKDEGEIGELITAFKNVLFGITGSKSEKIEYTTGNEKMNFPMNYMYGKEIIWRNQFKKIPEDNKFNGDISN